MILKNNSKESRRRYITHLSSRCKASSGAKNRDIECWNMFNEFYDEKEFDYLTKSGEYTLPAKIRNVGKQRPKINHLISQKARRKFNYSVIANDKLSLRSKYDLIMNKWLDSIDKQIEARYHELVVRIQMLDEQINQFNQAVDSMKQNKNADPAEIQRLEALRPVYTMQFNMLKSELSRKQLFTEMELAEIEEKMQLNSHDIREILSQKLSKYLYTKLEIDFKSTKAFTSKAVTGKEHYYVNYRPGSKKIDFDYLNSMKVYYPAIETIQWIQNGPWVNITDLESIHDVKRLYQSYLDPKDWSDLEESIKYRSEANIAVTPDQGAIFSDGVYAATSDENTAEVVKVSRFYYKVERKVGVKRSPNQYTGGFFTHFIDGSKKVLSSKEWKYSKGKYVNLFTNDVISKENVEFIDDSKNETYKEQLIYDRWIYVVLNDRFYIDLGIDEIQPRTVDEPYDVILPVVGRTFSNITERPYSLMWSTKDLQKLYRIVHYHRELALAISGSRGSVVDLSQKPKSMSREEWWYHKKLGRIPIESMDKNGRKNSSFNQWQTYDDTMIDVIQYFDAVLQGIDSEISDTIGMPRQRMGVTVPQEGVGSNKLALEQSLLTTEIIYNEHDVTLAKAFSLGLNMTVKYCLDEDELIEILSNGKNREIYKIPKGLLKNIDWEILVYNSTIDDEKINELKQLAIRQNDKGLLPFQNLLTLWTEDSVLDVYNKFVYFSKKQDELMKMSQSSAKQDQMEIEKMKIQMANEYKAYADQIKNQLEASKLELERVRIENEKVRDLMNARIQEKKLEQDRSLKIAEIQSEREMELAYLRNQDIHESRNESLQGLQLSIESMLKQAQLSLMNKDLDIFDRISSEKNQIEDTKARKKEQIKD